MESERIYNFMCEGCPAKCRMSVRNLLMPDKCVYGDLSGKEAKWSVDLHAVVKDAEMKPYANDTYIWCSEYQEYGIAKYRIGSRITYRSLYSDQYRDSDVRSVCAAVFVPWTFAEAPVCAKVKGSMDGNPDSVEILTLKPAERATDIAQFHSAKDGRVYCSYWLNKFGYRLMNGAPLGNMKRTPEAHIDL